MYKRQVQDLAKDFFYACLTKTNYGIEAKNYLFGRGIGQNIIDEFKLGFAPNAWDKLSHAFKKRGISDLLLVKSGLAAERKNEGVYDRFRNQMCIRDRSYGYVNGCSWTKKYDIPSYHINAY